MRCNSLLHPSRRLECAMDEDIRFFVLAFPQTHHGGKSFPVVILLVFAPLPFFKLGFILRLPGKLSKSALRDAPFSVSYPYHGSVGPKAVRLLDKEKLRKMQAHNHNRRQDALLADTIRPTELAVYKLGRLNFSLRRAHNYCTLEEKNAALPKKNIHADC